MSDLSLILRVHIRTWLGGLRAKGIKGYGREILQVLLYLFLLGMFGFGAYKLLSAINPVLEQMPDLRADFYLNALMGLGITTVVFILLCTLNIVYTYIYESDDTAFLIATPLNPRAIFGARLIESYLLSLISTVPFSLSPMIALGIAGKASPVYYAVSVLGFISLVAVVMALSTLLIMVVVRYVPGQKMKQMLMVLGLLFGVVIVFISQFAAYKGTHMEGGHVSEIAKSLAKLKLGDVPVLPHAWLAHGSAKALLGSEESYWASLFPLVACAVLLIWLVVVLSSRMYLLGWAGNQESDRKARNRRRAKAHGGNLPQKRLFNGPFFAMVRKEFKLLGREPVLWYNFAIGIIVVVFFIFNLSGQSGGGDMPVEFKKYFVMFMLIFGATVGGNQLACSALSREGGTWGLLSASPIGPRTVYCSKLLVSALPSAALSVVGLTALSAAHVRNIPLLPLWVSLPLDILIILVLSSIMLSSDVLFPNFDIKLGANAKGKGSSAAALKVSMASLGSMAYFVLMGFTLAFPLFYKEIGWFRHWPNAAATAAGYGLFALETVGITVVGYILSMKSLGNLMAGGGVAAKGSKKQL